MKITRTVAVAGLAGVLGVAGLAGVVAPAAFAATTSDATDGPLQAIRDALAGLVSDGTLTQEQADTVASTLDEAGVLHHGHGGPRFGRLLDLEVAAETLGITPDELRTALGEEGTTLADVAEEQGVETSVLVEALVAAATERLQDAVADGRLTQEQADERAADLPEQLAAAVERELRGPGHGHGHGFGGPGRRGGDDSTTPSPTPEPSATTQGSST